MPSTAMKTPMYLTKSLFKSSLECSRKLLYKMWLHKQQHGRGISRQLLQEPLAPSSFLNHLAAEGYMMNRYVQRLYNRNGNGRLIESRVADDAVRETEELLMESVSPVSSSDGTNAKGIPTIIYEGAMQWKHCFVRTDMLQIVHHPTDGANDHQQPILKLMEVKAKAWDSSQYSSISASTDGELSNHPMMTKAGTAMKAEYEDILHDIAFQYYIVSQAYPQYTIANKNILCSFVFPDKSKINTTTPGLYNMFDLHTTQQKEDVDRDLDFNVNHEALCTEVDITSIIPLILRQPIIYPGCHDTNPKTFIEVINDWNDIMERFNNTNSDFESDDTAAFNDDDRNDMVLNQFISQILTGKNDTNAATTVAPIGSHCKGCEFRNKNHTDTSYDTSHSPSTVKSGFDYCWGSILKANAIVKKIGDSKAYAERDGLEVVTKPSPPQLVIDLYYGGKTVTDMLQQNKYFLCEITKQDLKLLETTEDTAVASMKRNSNKKKKKTKSKATVGMSRKERQWYSVQSSSSNSLDDTNNVVLYKDYLSKAFNECQYPYHFIDFETITPVLPFTINKHPYEPIAFQFSHHMLHENGVVTHATEFIQTTPGVCPNLPFLLAIHDTFEKRYTNGTIFRWGAHENTILRSIYANTIDETERPSFKAMDRFFGTAFSDDTGHISDVNIIQDGMVDLMSIASKGYYVRGSNASVSIKSLLLPTLQYSTHLRDLYEAPTYSSSNFNNMQWWVEYLPGSGIPIDPYKLLQNMRKDISDDVTAAENTVVAHGGDAIAAYSMLQRHDIEMNARQQVEQSLRRYCELDTLAMVMITQALLGYLE